MRSPARASARDACWSAVAVEVYRWWREIETAARSGREMSNRSRAEERWR